MAVTTTYKSLAFARVLTDKFSLRYGILATPLFVATGNDASGNPLIAIADTLAHAQGLIAGTGTAGAQQALLRILPWPSIGSDSLGNAQKSYGPHKIQIATEASATAGVDIMTEVNKLPMMGESLQTHCTVELWQEANLTAPSVSTFNTATKQVASFDALNNAGTGTM